MEKIKDIKVSSDLLSIEPNSKVLYDAIILSRAGLRQGTHDTKNRAEVRGGGRKPWRQKGTGRARAGSNRSVIWVGGGGYGTPTPRDYSKKQNRKERRLAIQTAFINLYNDNGLVVVDELKFVTPKTKEMVAVLQKLEIADKKVLFVVTELEENIVLSSRNLSNCIVVLPSEVNVLDLVSAEVLVTTKEGLLELEEVLK